MRRLLALTLLLLVVAACASTPPDETPVPDPSLRAGEFAIPTIGPPIGSTPDACPAALMTGTLVQLDDGSLGLASSEERVRVRWPFGWRGATGTPVALVDATGTVVATVGQTVEVGGGFIDDDWLGCGGVTVVG